MAIWGLNPQPCCYLLLAQSANQLSSDALEPAFHSGQLSVIFAFIYKSKYHAIYFKQHMQLWFALPPKDNPPVLLIKWKQNEEIVINFE